MTLALSNKWASLGVTVKSIAPRHIETAVTGDLRTAPSRQRQILERIPAGHWGRPEDIAEAAIFLARDAVASYVTGTTIAVDGEWLVH